MFSAFWTTNAISFSNSSPKQHSSLLTKGRSDGDAVVAWRAVGQHGQHTEPLSLEMREGYSSLEFAINDINSSRPSDERQSNVIDSHQIISGQFKVETQRPIMGKLSDIDQKRPKSRARILADEPNPKKDLSGIIDYNSDGRFFNATSAQPSMKFNPVNFTELSPLSYDAQSNNIIQLTTNSSGAIFEIPLGITEITVNFADSNCRYPILQAYTKSIPPIVVNSQSSLSTLSIKTEIPTSLLNSKVSASGNFNVTNSIYATRALKQSVKIPSTTFKSQFFGVIFCALWLKSNQPFKAQLTISAGTKKMITIPTLYNDQNELNITSVNSSVGFSGETHVNIKGEVGNLRFVLLSVNAVLELLLMSNNDTTKVESIGTNKMNRPFEFNIDNMSNFTIIVKNTDKFTSYPFSLKVSKRLGVISDGPMAGIIIGAIVGFLLVVLITLGIIWYLRQRKGQELRWPNFMRRKTKVEETNPDLPKQNSNQDNGPNRLSRVDTNENDNAPKQNFFNNFSDKESNMFVPKDVDFFNDNLNNFETEAGKRQVFTGSYLDSKKDV